MNDNLKTEVYNQYINKLKVRVCGIVEQDDSILLINHKYSNSDKSFWSPPGGTIEYLENIENCLIREFKEETNLLIDSYKYMCCNEFIEEPFHVYEHFFKVNLASKKYKLGTDPEYSENSQIMKEIIYMTKENIVKNKNIVHPVIVLYALNNKLDNFIIQKNL